MKKSSTKWRGLVILAGALIIAGLLLSACGSSDDGGGASPSAAATPKPGGTYLFPLSSDPLAVDPVGLQEVDAEFVSHQIFQGLYTTALQPDGSTKSVPDLLDKQTISADAKTFTFTIKQGIMFGPPVSREVTAQDFVDSWNYALDPANESVSAPYIFQNLKGLDPKSGYAYAGKPLTSVKVIDKYTFEATLNQSFTQWPLTLCYTATKVFPVDYAKQLGSYRAFADKPVGTGPYMLQSWKHGTGITLLKDPDYWNNAGDSGNSATPGYVDEIDYKIYRDINTEYLAFQKGDIDYTAIPPGSWIASQNLPNVKTGQWTAKLYPTLSTAYVNVDMSSELGGSAYQPLRAALNYAADREAVCNVVFQGTHLPLDGLAPTIIPGYQPGLNPYPSYDAAKAQAEIDKMTAAGTKIPNPIPLWVNSGQGHEKWLQALIAGWTKAMPSLNFKLKGLETNAYWTKVNAHELPGLFRYGWQADYPLLDNFIYLFTTQGGVYGSSGLYSNKQVDALFAQARATPDVAQSDDLYNQAQKLILTDAPTIPIYSYRDARLSNNRLGGFDYNSMTQIDMWLLWVK